MRWEQLPGGSLRFRGDNAMRDVLALVCDDEDYLWSLAPWPYSWIDVYPKNPEAQNLLLEVVE